MLEISFYPFSISVELVDALEEQRHLLVDTDAIGGVDLDSVQTMEEFSPDSPTLTTARRRLFCTSSATENT